MSIKEEIQGPKGYLKEVREQYMPNTKIMARLALKKYQAEQQISLNKGNIERNADEILKGLFKAETDIFLQKNQEIMLRLLPYYFAVIYSKKDNNYIETSERMSKLLDVYSSCREGTISEEDFIVSISDITVPIIDIVSFSQKQSAKCRVGETLQNHLAGLLDICDIKYETQQRKTEGGTVMDFIVPSLEAIEQMPDQVINIECQTTLKDRFRLTTGKSTDGKIKRYLATITGAGIVTARDLNDFTVDKVKEIIIDNNVTLVVLDYVKDNIINTIDKYIDNIEKGVKNTRSSVTLGDAIKLKKLSSNKIISYTELINRDLKTIMIYWDGENK